MDMNTICKTIVPIQQFGTHWLNSCFFHICFSEVLMKKILKNSCCFSKKMV